MLHLKLREEPGLIRTAEIRPQTADHPGGPSQMPVADLVHLSGRLELLPRVFAHRLQQPEAPVVAPVAGDHK